LETQQNVTQHWRRWLIGLIFVAAIVLAATVVTHNVLTEPYPGENDFMSSWGGVHAFWIEGFNPYSEQASLSIQQRVYGRPALEGEDLDYFVYPFYDVFLLWPLVYLPYAWASAIWMVLLEAALITALFLLFDLFRWRPSPLVTAVLTLWTLIFYFPARGLILGQPGVLVYFLEVVALWALVKQQDLLAGVMLALSTVKPQMGFLIVPFLLLWGLRCRRWRFVGAFTVSMLVLLVGSFVVQPSWLGDWLGQLQRYTGYTALGSPVWIITTYYLGLGQWVELVVSGIIALAMLLAWYWVLWRREDARFLWAAVLTLTVTHLIAPRTATPHYAVFIIPLIFYFAAIYRRDRRRGNLWIVLMALALLIFSWVHFLTTVVGEFEHPTVYLPLPFAMLFILWWMRRMWWQSSVKA
jgi:Glycosyltransferase family 87